MTDNDVETFQALLEDEGSVLYTTDGEKLEAWPDGGGGLQIARRSDTELLEAMSWLAQLVWYRGRHAQMLDDFENRRLVAVDREVYENLKSNEERDGIIERESWKKCVEIGDIIRSMLGDLAVRDMSDLEWGMWLGKLSALRWVLGDRWDDLDTG
jgi:hypothetical protein